MIDTVKFKIELSPADCVNLRKCFRRTSQKESEGSERKYTKTLLELWLLVSYLSYLLFHKIFK